jgi:hypothetical protein
MVTVSQKISYVEQAAKGGWLLLFNHGVECQAGRVVEENGRLRIRPQQE